MRVNPSKLRGLAQASSEDSEHEDPGSPIAEDSDQLVEDSDEEDPRPPVAQEIAADEHNGSQQLDAHFQEYDGQGAESEEDHTWLTPVETDESTTQDELDLEALPVAEDSDSLSEGFVSSVDDVTDAEEIEETLFAEVLDEILQDTGIDYKDPSMRLSFEDLYNIAWDHLSRNLTQRMAPRVRDLAHAGGAPKAADYRTMRKRMIELTGTAPLIRRRYITDADCILRN